MKKSITHIAVPPGATIKEQLEDRGMTQKEFASRMDLSEKHICNLIAGDVKLTSDVAYRLEMVLGLPAAFWSKLEASYRDTLTKVAKENALEEDMQLAGNFPYKEMAKNGWVADVKNKLERVTQLRKFFEVAELSLMFKDTSLQPKIAYRQQNSSSKDKDNEFTLLAWAQKAKLEAREMEVGGIDMEKLSKELPNIRALTAEAPESFCPILTELLAQCGIALVLLPHIGGSFLHGATFEDRNKIVIGLTLRGKYADKFWFSLFHELGHILCGHLNKPENLTDDDEAQADSFARDQLIKPEDYDNFTQKKSFTRNSITAFAEKIGIAPGIVVGRLQKEGLIDYSWLNDLKTKYEFAAA